MEAKDWNRIKEIFAECLEADAASRNGLLETVEPELRREVEELLANYKDAADYIDQPAAVEFGATELSTDRTIGTRIDDYLILDQIGTGGMGAVYLAEQQGDNLHHRVALKLIKRGMDTDLVLKRFVQERQILANLEHPNIARFLDGGSTTDGLPYFVMEYVEGSPIRKFADESNLDTRQRLNLFRKVCGAVSFAHQNLIVHRDLKPSNILVSHDGEPKLLDFGIAKLLNADWSADTAEATATMFRVMTPEYASPEQLRGDVVTTSSDVYSLGIILYELLTGQRPFKVESHSPDEIANHVLASDPLRPSSVVEQSAPSDIATDADDPNKTAPEDLKFEISNFRSRSRALRGDLDNIILKALQKEPSRRYASVQEFSDDVRRHLDGLPVSASADTLSYRAAKFVKRHRTGVLSASLVALILVSTTTLTAWQARQANMERAKANERFSQVRKLANLVIFEYHDGIQKLAGSTAIREKMVRDAVEYLDGLAAEASDSPELKKEIASAYQKVGDVQGNPYLANLGDLGGAHASYSKALGIRAELLGSNPDDVSARVDHAVSLEKLADVIWAKGDYAGALDRYTESLGVYTALESQGLLPSTSAYSFVLLQNRMGQSREKSGDLEGAFTNYNQSVKHVERLLEVEPDNPRYRRGLAVGHIKLGDIAHLMHRYEEAHKIFTAGKTMFERIVETDPANAGARRELTLMLARLAATETELSDFERSLSTNRKTIEIQEKLAADDPQNIQIQFDIGDTYTNYGETLTRMGRLDEASEALMHAAEIMTQARSKSQDYSHAASHVANTHQKYGDLLLKSGKVPRALENYRIALKLFEPESVKKEAPEILASTLEGLGDALVVASANRDEAVSMYESSLSIWQRLLDEQKLFGKHAGKIDSVAQKLARLKRST